MAIDAEIEERTPLLSTQDDDFGRQSRLSASMRNRAVVLCYAFIILIEVGVYLQVSPLNAVVEQRICQKYYPDIHIDSGSESTHDARCKTAQVQGELAMLRGWQSMFEFIPGIITAVPYGIAMDKKGRKVVLRLALLGITLQCGFYILVCWLQEQLAMEWTWFSAVFLLIGGGPMVVNSVLFVIIADTVLESKRASTFFYLGAAVLCGEIIASPLASIFMEFDPWIPIFMGFVVIASNNFLLLALPETSTILRSSCPSPNLATNEPIISTGISDPLLEGMKDKKTRFVSFLRSSWSTVRDRNVLLLLMVFVVATLGRFAQEILMQYVTKRYEWTWSQAGYLLSVRGVTNLILLLAILPALGHFLTSYMCMGAQRKDLWLARASALNLAFGAFCIGLAPTAAFMILGLAIFALGAGFTLIVRSLVASFVHSDQLGTLYSLIAVLESVGALIAGPMLSLTFREGLRLGGGWIGLPWISAGILLSLALTAVSMVKLNTSSVRIVPFTSPTLPPAKIEYDVSMVEEADIPAIANFALDTEDCDPTSASMFPPTHLESTKALIATRLQHALRNDKASRFIKVQNAEGFILGYARWQVPDVMDDEQEIRVQKFSKAIDVADGFDTEPFEQAKAALFDVRKKHIDANTAYILALIAVERLHRRKGVASALLYWGLNHADGVGADSWVETTRATIPFYENFGWVTVDEIEMDTVSGKVKGDSLFCMLRKPLLGKRNSGL